MPQFFFDKKLEPGNEIELRGPDAHHISQVLRLKAGDWIVLSDGEGRSFDAEITASLKGSVSAKAGRERPSRKDATAPSLALALIKGDRFEWAIQKVVELGCRRILPFTSERTVPQYGAQATEKKLARWNQIAMEAAKQSGLPFKPKVEGLVNFSALCADIKGKAVLFYEGEKYEGLGTVPASPSDILIIGPEGGFTSEEIETARNSGARTVSLGVQILRVETAAIASLAIWQFRLGNMEP